MKTRSAVLGILTLVGLCSSSVAFAQTVQFSRYFMCNGERLAVQSCFNDADDAKCMVLYPDRPLRNGFEVQNAERRGDVIAKIKGCVGPGATLASTGRPASRPAPSAEGQNTPPRPLQTTLPAAKRAPAAGASDEFLKQFKDADGGYTSKDHIHFDGHGGFSDDNGGHGDKFGFTFVNGSFKDAAGNFYDAKTGIITAPEKDADGHHKTITVGGQGYTNEAIKQGMINLEISAKTPLIDIDAEENESILSDHKPTVAGTQAQAYVKQGDQYLNGAEYARAVEAYNKAIALEPSLGNAYYGIALAYFKEGQYQLAVSSLKRAQTTVQFSAADFVILGEALVETKQYDEALKAYESATRLQAAPDRLSYAYYRIGEIYSLQERYAQAIAPLQEALRLEPNYDSAAFALGRAYTDLEQYKNALEPFQRAVRLKPNDPDYQCRLGDANLLLGDYPSAVAALQQATRLKPDYAECHSLLGLAYVAAGNKEQALQVYKRLQALDKELAQDLLKEINEMSAKASAPAGADAFLALGRKYLEANEYPKAIEAYKKAIALAPDSAIAADAYLGIGKIDLEQKQYQVAINDLGAALRLKPRDAEVNFELGYAFLCSGGYGQATSLFEKAIRLQPDYADPYYFLGLTYDMTGHKEDALKVYEKLKSVDKKAAQKLYNEIQKPKPPQ